MDATEGKAQTSYEPQTRMGRKRMNWTHISSCHLCPWCYRCLQEKLLLFAFIMEHAMHLAQEPESPKGDQEKVGAVFSDKMSQQRSHRVWVAKWMVFHFCPSNSAQQGLSHPVENTEKSKLREMYFSLAELTHFKHYLPHVYERGVWKSSLQSGQVGFSFNFYYFWFTYIEDLLLCAYNFRSFF